MKLIIEGRQSDVKAAWTELSQAAEDSFSVESIKESKPDPLDRKPAGMEPLTYFVVVFAGHLAASAAHDLLTRKIGPAVQEQWKKLNKKEDDSATS